MKLLRYGPKGQEKPGLLDADGKIRDLSGVVKDIDGAVLADLSKVRAADVKACRWWQMACASPSRWPRSASSSASA